jgi:hypothetical protein
MFGWGWGRWLLLLLGILVVAAYFGLLSGGRLEESIQWLASKGGADGSFKEPGAGRGEAFFIVMAFLFLTPVAILGGIFLLVFALVVLAGTLHPVARVLGLPQWSMVGVVAIVLAGVGYANLGRWLPELLRLSGIIAQALLSLAP